MWVFGKLILCFIMYCNKEFDNGYFFLGYLKRFDYFLCDLIIILYGFFFSFFVCVICYKKFVI